MSLIDQRILIVAPVEAVWNYVADPRQVSKWHQGCKQVSVLTTRATGVGTRRRCVDENGRATVEETTAWFENIGYEYVVIDGPYRDFRGRFRLQAIPEGTIVNWTVEYHLRGLLAGPRNILSFRRHFEDLMAESLRSLRKLLENSGVRLDPDRHARYAMQNAPSAESRASRSAPPEVTTRPGAKDAPSPAALRPVSMGEDDVPELPANKPSDSLPDKPVNIPGLAAPTLVRPQPAPPEADAILSMSLPEPPVDLEDTKPRPPKGLREALAANPPEQSPVVPSTNMDEPSDISRARSAPTVPISMVAPPYEPPPVQETQTMGIVPPSTLPEVPPSEPFKKGRRLFEPEIRSDVPPARSSVPEQEPAGPFNPADLPAPPQTTKEDTGEISIWDAFGLERPSEKAQADLEAIIASLQPKPGSAGHNGHFTARYWKRKRSKAAPRVRGITSNRALRLKASARVRSAHR